MPHTNILNKLPDDTNDRLRAFFFGDAIVTLYTLLGGIGTEIKEAGVKIVVTIILGVAGGIAGMVGKDIYKWWKMRKIKKQKP